MMYIDLPHLNIFWGAVGVYLVDPAKLRGRHWSRKMARLAGTRRCLDPWRQRPQLLETETWTLKLGLRAGNLVNSTEVRALRALETLGDRDWD